MFPQSVQRMTRQACHTLLQRLLGIRRIHLGTSQIASGQFSFFRQLHSLGVAGFFSAALLSTALLCALMIAMVLGMQL